MGIHEAFDDVRKGEIASPCNATIDVGSNAKKCEAATNKNVR